jgi:putative GTP pyrophosphokinase
MTFSITKEDFLQKYNINLVEFEQAGIIWDNLVKIANDWINEISTYKSKVREITHYLYDCPCVHSIRYRVKDPEHLIDKIIRKTITNADRVFTVENYRKEIQDLGGIRVIHLYKHQNINIHNFIIAKNEFKLQEKIAYLRPQEEHLERSKLNELGFDIKIPDGNEKIYSSLHYIFDESRGDQNYLFEVQVRTIFEEGWAEIDHHFNYPKRTSCNFTRDAIDNLNHAVFLCNNLASTIFNMSGTQAKKLDTAIILDEYIYELCKQVCMKKNYASAPLLQIELKINYNIAKEAILKMESEKFIHFAKEVSTPRAIYQPQNNTQFNS